MKQLQADIREFVHEREWEQFHSPRNLAASLSVEAGELLEHYQWTDAVDKEAVSEEMADVFWYLLRLADVLDVDLTAATYRKIGLNSMKYPTHLAKGRATKYTQLS